MITSIFRFSLDLHSLHSQVTIPAFQGDTSITLYITITDGGRPVTLPTGCLAKLTIKRPTGTYLEDFCMIQDNLTIVYPFAQNEGTCAVEGINECDITLFSSQGGNVGSPRFTIMVAEKVMKKDDIVIADEDYKIAEAMATAEAARQLAETGRVEAEAARVEAENARSAAEQGRVDADAVRAEFLTGINDRLSTLEDGHTIDHRKLTDRDAEDSHPISAITGLAQALEQFGSVDGTVGERLAKVESDVSTLLDNIDEAGEAPTFDLIALGLPAVGPSNGFQGVTCDTTEIRAALDKGAVQFKVKLLKSDGVTEYEATILMGSIETVGDAGSKAFTCSCRASGNYEIGAEGIALTDFAELTIMVTETNVMAVMANLLHVPSVTESANGKVLTVVNGEWQAAAPQGADITVDTELSETSENPVQNKVIAKAVAESEESMTQLASTVALLGERVLPEATQDGKILQVVDGKWQAADAPSSGGGGGDGSGSGLPEAAQDGMMLQVVDGAWTAVTVADSSIKTYIDDYINEALGGDY